MEKLKTILTAFLVALIFVGCNKDAPTSNNTITVGNVVFSVEQINEGIKNTFNKNLYYHGDNSNSPFIFSNKDLVLNKDLVYELYFQPANGRSPAKVYFTITNVAYPLSTDGQTMLYEFGITISESGMCSDFSYGGHCLQGAKYDFINEHTVYLGRHTITVDTIREPKFEKMDAEWKARAEEAIRIYMDENDFYSDKNKNLESGKYKVYVEGFFKSDTDSTIVFVNENGAVYSGIYYFVHNIPSGASADLNKVEQIQDSDEATKAYLEALRSSAVLVMEHEID